MHTDYKIILFCAFFLKLFLKYLSFVVLKESLLVDFAPNSGESGSDQIVVEMLGQWLSG